MSARPGMGAGSSVLSSPRVQLTLAQRAADRHESAAYEESSAHLDDPNQARWGQRPDQTDALAHPRSAGTYSDEAAEEQCEWDRGGQAVEDRHTAWSPEDQMRWSRDAEFEAALESEAAQSKVIQQEQEMIRQLQEALHAETQARLDAEAVLTEVLSGLM